MTRLVTTLVAGILFGAGLALSGMTNPAKVLGFLDIAGRWDASLLFVPQFAHAGLALSIGIGALVNAGWLFIGLRRAGLYQPEPGWAGFSARVVVATALMGAGLYWAAQHLDWIAMRTEPWLRIGALAACLAGAGLVYFLSLAVAGIQLRQFARRG